MEKRHHERFAFRAGLSLVCVCPLDALQCIPSQEPGVYRTRDAWSVLDRS